MNPSHHSWLLGQSHPAIELVLIAIGVEPEYRFITRSLSRWGPKVELNASITTESEIMDFFETVEVDLTIRLIHDSYHYWEQCLRFLEAVEVDLTIRLVHDSYRCWEQGHRFLKAVGVDMTIGLVHDSYRR
jgi:hypothetical protein